MIKSICLKSIKFMLLICSIGFLGIQPEVQACSEDHRANAHYAYAKGGPAWCFCCLCRLFVLFIESTHEQSQQTNTQETISRGPVNEQPASDVDNGTFNKAYEGNIDAE